MAKKILTIRIFIDDKDNIKTEYVANIVCFRGMVEK